MANALDTMYGQPQQLGLGGYTAPAVLTPATAIPFNATPPPTPAANGATSNMSLNQFGPQQVINDLVTGFTSPNNPYIAAARQRGIEAAGGRGLLNSTLAGSQAERAGIEAAQPLVSEAVGLLNAREQRAAQRDLTRDNIQQQAVLSDWLDSNKFNREFNANLSLLPIKNTFDMFNTIMQNAAANPKIWTPDVVSGTSNFFQRNMFDVLNQYFPGTFVKGGS